MASEHLTADRGNENCKLYRRRAINSFSSAFCKLNDTRAFFCSMKVTDRNSGLRGPALFLLFTILFRILPAAGTSLAEAAQINQANSPGSGVAERLLLPQIQRKTLLNGMQVIFFNQTSDTIPFKLMIKNGAAFDPADKWGATYLMSLLMTDVLNDPLIKSETDSRNVRIECEVTWDAIIFSGEAPSREIGYALDLLADLVIRPDFREESFERIKEEHLEEVILTEALLDNRVSLLLAEKVFTRNPYGKPAIGTSSSIPELQLNDLIVQYRRLVLPNQAALAIAFSEEREGLFNYLSRRWGSWVRRNPAPFVFRRSQRYSEPEIAIIEADRRQGIVSWGLLGFEKSSRESISMEVLEQYLTLALPNWASEIASAGQIRGSIESTSMRMPGFLKVSLEIPVQHLSSYYRKLLATLDEISSGNIDQSQFEDAKQIVLTEFRSSLEQTEGQMDRVLETDLYELGINFIPTFGLRLSRVSESKFQDTIKSLVPDKSHVMIASGPKQEIEEQIGKN